MKLTTKRHSLLIIFVLFILLILSGYFLCKNAAELKTVSDKYWDTVNCDDCEILRITQTVTNGPILQAEPQKVWEVVAKVGSKTESGNNPKWSMEIIDKKEDRILLNFKGEIYKDLEKVQKPILISKSSPVVVLDSGTVGGGTSWDLYYYQK